MRSNASLCLKILSILKSTDNELSLYDLMQLLESGGYDISASSESADGADDYNVKMYRKNFIVMNGLYQLRNELSGSGYYLFISSLKIAILPENVAKSHEVTINPGDVPENVAYVQSLADYYLDWHNFNSVDKNDVDRLLIGFWTQFAEHNDGQRVKDKQSLALKTLGLEGNASWADIQLAYRCMVTKSHPDKGGESHQFIEIREAYQTLKLINMG